jgi:hypothetical protein
MLKVTLTGSEQLITRLQNKRSTILQVLQTRLNAILIQLQRYVVVQKLSGQVLHRRTGKLANSVRVIPATVKGSTVSGRVEAAGGPAFYGAINEMGNLSAYDIINTRARALAFISSSGEKVFAMRVRHPQIMARPFLRPSLEENEASIIAQLQDAVNQELQK